MGVIRTSANTSFDDFVTSGVPASGAKQISKSAVRATFGVVEDRIDAVEAAATFGIRWTTNVIRVRSTGNVAIATALENGDTLNGVTLATGNHVFLGSQTAPAENGIYTVVASGAASRATFADTAAELAYIGFLIAEGTVGAGERWTLSLASSAITVGTTALNFSPVGVEVDYGAEIIAARDGEASLTARLTEIDGKVRSTGDNTAVGVGAGISFTTADENVLFGPSAGQFITTGVRNAVIGEAALSTLTTGGNNSALGRASLINLTTGSENVAAGSAAGASLTGAAGRNTFLGTDAGFNGSQKVDASSSIGLGRGAYTTKDFQCVLGSAEITETVLFGALLVGHGGPELARLDGPNENYFIGDAGPATLPTGGGNVAVGKDAGNALTTCVASVYVGKDAGKAVTTGVDHTFVGAGAGLAQVSGVGCVALGRLAGKTSVSATNWTALGDTALEFNVSDGAVGVGYGCGRDHTSGTGFCGVGLYAGGYGNANRTTVMGTEALGGVANVDYGDDNAVFGYRGMGSATGSNNSGLGAEVFINLTTGSFNTGIGRQAGSRLTTGTYCTFLGYNAGQPAGQKVDAVNSTAIGANAVTTKSNQVVIGDANVVETLLRGQIIVGAETTGSTGKVDVLSVKSSTSNPAGGQMILTDQTPLAAGVGGQLVFRGVYNSGGALTEAAAVQAQKSNSTSGEFGFDLTFHTRVNGGSNTEKLRITTDGVLKQITFTVAALPAASVGAGSRAFVTDANATTFASIVAGGGANGVPVYSDGTSWRIG